MKNWTPEDIQFLKDNWNVIKTKEIAESLNRTTGAIHAKAKVLNLGPNKTCKNRRWTPEETEYLEESWGRVAVKTIMKNLKRSKNAILLRVQRLGLGPFLEAGDYITLNQLLMSLYGYHAGKEYTIKQFLAKGLPVKKRRVDSNRFSVIYLEDFWDWAEMNSTLIDFSKLEPLALGKEPDWVDDKRAADIKKRMKFKYDPWTKEEDKQLEQLLGMYKYNYRDLSLKLRRTEGAIKRRLCTLGIKARPLKMPNHNPWTEEEIAKLIELYHKGHTPSTMADDIPRSAQAISGKIERMIIEKRIFPRSEFRKSC